MAELGVSDPLMAVPSSQVPLTKIARPGTAGPWAHSRGNTALGQRRIPQRSRKGGEVGGSICTVVPL